MQKKYCSYQVVERVGYITLNRPEKKNALNHDFVAELKELFSLAEEDPSAKVLVLQSSSDVFSAGADLDYIKSLQQNSYEENLSDSHHLMQLFKEIFSIQKIVIAKVEGHAIAGGCGLATVCDFVFATEESKFGYTEVKIGFIPAIVSVFLVRKIGLAKSKELLLTGKLITAQDAKAIGIINDVIAKENINDFVEKFAIDLCETISSESVAATKKLLNKVQDLKFEDAFMYAAESNAKSRITEDCKRGISAFLNKEKISW
jgi:methylglutaconyl-CoA hydratase